MIEPNKVGPAPSGGTQRLYFFDNGYGASVIEGGVSYGVELAVIKGNQAKWDLDFDNTLTDDVFPFLTEEEVQNILEQIRNL